MHRDAIEHVEHALPLHVLDELWIDGGYAAEHLCELGRLFANRCRCELHHGCEPRPVLIDLEVPMRLVVRLISKHYRFDHGEVPCAPVARCPRGEPGKARTASGHWGIENKLHVRAGCGVCARG